MATRSVTAFTENDIDIETLIQRMFQLMTANGALPSGMTIDEARPYLKGMIIVDSARRQNIHVESVEIPNQDVNQDVEDEEPEDHAFPIQISPSRADNSTIETKIEQDVGKTPTKPPGIDIEGLDMSALAHEKVQRSAKAFGFIRPIDDITLREDELLNLEKSKKSFGLVMTPEEHAAAFLKSTQSLSLEERLSILMKATSEEGSDIESRHEAAKQQMDALLTRLRQVKTEIEPLYVELIVIEQQMDVVKTCMKTDLHRDKDCQLKMAKEMRDVQDQMMKAVRAAEAMMNTIIGQKSVESFNISSPTDNTNRKFSLGSTEPNLPCPRPADEPVDYRDHMGIPQGNARHDMPSGHPRHLHSQSAERASAYFSLSGSGRPTRGMRNDRASGAAIPSGLPNPDARRVNVLDETANVHTLWEYNSADAQQGSGGCVCCNSRRTRTGITQLLTQQHNMADRIRVPKQNKVDDENVQEEDEWESLDSGDRRRNKGKRPEDDDDKPSDDGLDNRRDNESDEEDRPSHKRSRDDDWKFDSRLLEPPKAYDGSDLAYFQPWLEMLRSEMMNTWEPWGKILDVLEEAGEKRLDPNPIQIISILDKLKTKKNLAQIKNEMFRILKGMTSGDAQSSIVQGATRNILDVFRRLISKGKSWTKAAVREFRQRIIMPRRAKDVVDYDVAAA